MLFALFRIAVVSSGEYIKVITREAEPTDQENSRVRSK
jgi:hypothetical protein